MSDDIRVRTLVEQVLETERSPEEVCRECPELLPQVRCRVEQVRGLEVHLGGLFPAAETTDALTAGQKPNAVSAATTADQSNTLSAPPGRDLPSGYAPPLAQRLRDLLLPPIQPDELGRLGRYRILRVLGAGGMGVVFLAEDTNLQRRVALKVMRPELSAVADHRERFLREARSAALIEHDHIVTIFHVEEAAGVQMLAMQLLQGESLQDRLQREKVLAPEEAARIGREMAEALQAAHERGLIHRDVKPANIWLESQRGRVKVLDFGLARPLQGGSQLTQPGLIVGTPAYMAPEQADGGEIDARADLFSLGAVLYRMVTGEPPFRGATPLMVLRSLACDTPRPPQQVNPAVPPELSNLILRLLSKAPSDRPGSAAQVARELAPFENAAAPRLHDRSAERRPRWRRWLAVATVASVALAGLFLATVAGREEGAVSVKVAVPDVKVVIDDAHTNTVGPEKPWKAALAPGEHRLAATWNQEKFACTFTVKAARTIEIVVPFQPEGAPPDPTDFFEKRHYEDVPAAERFDWQPKELIAVVGSSHYRSFPCLGREAQPRLTYGREDKQLRFAYSIGDTVRVTDVATGKPLQVVRRPRPLREDLNVRHAVVSADGAFAAQIGGRREDWTWTVWELATGAVRTTIRGSGDPIPIDLVFSPNARLIVANGSMLYDGFSGKQIEVGVRPPRTTQKVAALFSPDGKTLVLVGFEENGFNVGTWDVPTWKPGPSFKTRPGTFLSGMPPMALAPNGRWLAVGGTVRQIWDVATGKEGPKLSPADDSANWRQVAFASDGTLLACGCDEDLIRLYDLVAAKEQRSLPGGGNVGLTFSPDGKALAAADTRMVRLWNVETGQQLNKTQDGFWLSSVAPDGRKLALFNQPPAYPLQGPLQACSYRELLLYDLPGQKPGPKFELPPPGEHVFFGTALSADARYLAATLAARASGRGGVRVYDLNNKDVDGYVTLPELHDRALGPDALLSFTSDGSALVSTGFKSAALGMSVSWTVPGWKESASSEWPGKAGEVLSLSPDARTLARAVGQEVWLQEVATGKTTTTCKAPAVLRKLALSRDGKRLAAVTESETGPELAVLGVPAGEELFRASLPNRPYVATSSLGFGPDDQTVVITRTDGSIDQWCSATEYTRWELAWPIYHAAVFRDGRYLVTSNANGTLYLFRLPGQPTPPTK